MSLILYGIFIPNNGVALPTLLGVDGQPLLEIRAGGLAAAVSKSTQKPAPEISSLMAYEKIVAALHRSPTIGGVIPMRFGSTAASPPQVRSLLNERRQDYKALLRDIEGCEEMGIRLLLPCVSGWKGQNGTAGEAEDKNESQRPASGKAYLEARRACYANQEIHVAEKELIVEQCRAEFAQVSRRLRSEHRTVRDPRSNQLHTLVSLYLLVPRPSLPDFCRKAGEIRHLLPCKLMLSGPWPPFNFASPEAPTFTAPLKQKPPGGKPR